MDTLVNECISYSSVFSIFSCTLHYIDFGVTECRLYSTQGIHPPLPTGTWHPSLAQQHSSSKCRWSSSPTLTWKPRGSWPGFSCMQATLTLRITGSPLRIGQASTRQPLLLVRYQCFVGMEWSWHSRWPLSGWFMLFGTSAGPGTQDLISFHYCL